MGTTQKTDLNAASNDQLMAQFQSIRQATTELAEPLAAEDMVVQSMPDVSPTKWHLAHTSWFFETMLLKPYLAGYQVFDSSFEYLFNSYYNGVGKQFPRHRRGVISRPDVTTTLAYRRYVDDAMTELIANGIDEQARLRLEIGFAHEQQHQ